MTFLGLSQSRRSGELGQVMKTARCITTLNGEPFMNLKELFWHIFSWAVLIPQSGEFGQVMKTAGYITTLNGEPLVSQARL